MSSQDSEDSTKKVAMFLAGLTLLQSLRIALTGARFALSRFQIPQEQVSVFINMVHNPMELAALTGIAVINVLTFTSDGFKNGIVGCAIFTNVSLFLSYILLLFSFTSGGYQGNLTLYYWAIVLSSFTYGLNVACVMNVGSKNGSFFNVGIPLSGIQVCAYHYLFSKLAAIFGWSNASYRIILWQMIIAIFVSVVSAIAWTIAYSDPNGDGEDQCKCKKGESTCKCSCSTDSSTSCTQNCNCKCNCSCKTCKGKPGCNSGMTWEALKNAASPLLMGVVGMGAIYAFYPAIAPYKLTDVRTGYYIDLSVLFISAIPGITIVALCLYKKGPDTDWSTKAQGWHATWILAVPHITAMLLCFRVLHNPESNLAKYVRKSGVAVGVITITLKFCEEGLKAVSYAGAGTQDKGGGTLGSFNTFSSQSLMNVLAFMGDGYLKTYVLYENDRDKWPTKHYGRLRSLWFWIWNATKVSLKTIRASFTRDVRGAVLGKKEYLFIVHEDVPPDNEGGKYIFEMPKPRKKEYLFTI